MFGRQFIERGLVGLLGLVVVLGWSAAGTAAETKTMEFGLRGGTDTMRVEENYVAGELYVLKDLPWQRIIADDMLLKTRFDASAGYLQASADSGAWLSMGGDLVFVPRNWIEFEIGFRPTLLFDYEYGNDDYGGPVQFTSHAGLALVRLPFVLNYRIQHTSNSGLYDANDGLNLQFIGLGYRF